MFCKNCGAEFEGSFCPTCGTVAETAPVETVEAEPIKVEDPGKGKGLASMIMGIASLVLGSTCSCLFACLGGFVPAVLAIVSIVLGAMGINASKAAGFKNTKALVGIITSVLALVIILIFVIVNAVMGAAMYADLFDF